jgi:uncharacterized membrane protein YdjX (TVP38/TMEM64 family)
MFSYGITERIVRVNSAPILLTCLSIACILLPRMAETNDGQEAVKPPKSAWYLVALSVLAMIGLAVLAVIYREELRGLQQYGYLGAFIVNVLAGATVIVYVPGLPVVFALGGILDYPFLVGIAAGLGEGLGAFTTYGAGRGGHGLLSEKQRNNKHLVRVQDWMTRRGALTVFLASAVPNPVFALVGATAGVMRMPPWKFYRACAAGKSVKGIYIAYLGYWGLGYILQWFNIEL